MNGLGILCTFAVLLGAFLRLQSIEWGSHLYIYGLLAWFVISGIEISRLKKIIKKLDDRKFAE